MHFKHSCPLCEGVCVVRSVWDQCSQCEGLGGFDTWSKPCQRTHMHFKHPCRACQSKGWVPGQSSPGPPKVGRTIRYQKNSGYVLNVHNGAARNGAEVNLWERNGHESQRWLFQQVKSGSNCVRIHYAADPRFVLNLDGDERKDGAVINLWECTTSVSQQWLVEGGMIRYAASPGFVLNLHSGLEQNSAAVNLWQCTGRANQSWIAKGLPVFETCASSTALTLTANPAFCLNLPFNEHKNGAPLEVFSRNGHESQQWVFEKVLDRECPEGAVWFRILSKGNPNFCVNLHGNFHQPQQPVNLWQVSQHESQLWVLKDGCICHATNPHFCINVSVPFFDVEDETKVCLIQRSSLSIQSWTGAPRWLSAIQDSSDDDTGPPLRSQSAAPPPPPTTPPTPPAAAVIQVPGVVPAASLGPAPPQAAMVPAAQEAPRVIPTHAEPSSRPAESVPVPSTGFSLRDLRSQFAQAVRELKAGGSAVQVRTLEKTDKFGELGTAVGHLTMLPDELRERDEWLLGQTDDFDNGSSFYPNGDGYFEVVHERKLTWKFNHKCQATLREIKFAVPRQA